MHARLLLLSLAASLTLTGCVGVSIGGCERSRPAPVPAPIPGAPLTSADAATIAEIDAAARLTFDNQKLESLTRIARRSQVSSTVLVHLVNTTYRVLTFDNQKLELLKVIIESPAFDDRVRQAIVTQLQKLTFDNQRQELLSAIDRRLRGN